MATMRAKLKVSTVTTYEGGSQEVTMRAVAATEYGEDGVDENNTYAKFTPSADLKMHITNPDLLGEINAGDTFYVDFVKLEKAVQAA